MAIPPKKKSSFSFESLGLPALDKSFKTDNTRTKAPVLINSKNDKAAIVAAGVSKKKIDAKELQRRKTAIAESKIPTGFMDKGAAGDKMRFFPNDPNSIIDEYFNPLKQIGDMADDLGRSIESRNIKNIMGSVAGPLLAGATGAIGFPGKPKAKYVRPDIDYSKLRLDELLTPEAYQETIRNKAISGSKGKKEIYDLADAPKDFQYEKLDVPREIIDADDLVLRGLDKNQYNHLKSTMEKTRNKELELLDAAESGETWKLTGSELKKAQFLQQNPYPDDVSRYGMSALTSSSNAALRNPGKKGGAVMYNDLKPGTISKPPSSNQGGQYARRNRMSSGDWAGSIENKHPWDMRFDTDYNAPGNEIPQAFKGPFPDQRSLKNAQKTDAGAKFNAEFKPKKIASDVIASVPMNKKGGIIKKSFVPKMLNGGDPPGGKKPIPRAKVRKPIITDNPKDPRLISYNDSLHVFNDSKKALDRYPVINARYPRSEAQKAGTVKDLRMAFKEFKQTGKAQNPEHGYLFGKEYGHKIKGNSIYDFRGDFVYNQNMAPIEFQSRDGFADSLPVYKEPVQPYVYKAKPQATLKSSRGKNMPLADAPDLGDMNVTGPSRSGVDVGGVKSLPYRVEFHDGKGMTHQDFPDEKAGTEFQNTLRQRDMGIPGGTSGYYNKMQQGGKIGSFTPKMFNGGMADPPAGQAQWRGSGEDLEIFDENLSTENPTSPNSTAGIPQTALADKANAPKADPTAAITTGLEMIGDFYDKKNASRNNQIAAGQTTVNEGKSTGGQALGGAAKGAKAGAAFGPLGAGIGAVAGAALGFLGGKAERKRENREFKQLESVQKDKFQKLELSANLDPYGSASTFYAKDGGIVKMDDGGMQEEAQRSIVDIEKGEILIDPITLEVLREYKNPNRYKAHAKNPEDENLGNFTQIEEGKVVISKKYAARYLSGDVLTKKSIVLEILKNQRNEPQEMIKTPTASVPKADDGLKVGPGPWGKKALSTFEFQNWYNQQLISEGYDKKSLKAMSLKPDGIYGKNTKKAYDEEYAPMYNEFKKKQDMQGTEFPYPLEPDAPVKPNSGVFPGQMNDLNPGEPGGIMNIADNTTNLPVKEGMFDKFGKAMTPTNIARALNFVPTAFGLANAMKYEPEFYDENIQLDKAKAYVEGMETQPGIEASRAAIGSAQSNRNRMLNNINSPSARAEMAAGNADVIKAEGELIQNATNFAMDARNKKRGTLADLEKAQGDQRYSARRDLTERIAQNAAKKRTLLQTGLSEGVRNFGAQVMDDNKLRSLNTMLDYYKVNNDGSLSDTKMFVEGLKDIFKTEGSLETDEEKKSRTESVKKDRNGRVVGSTSTTKFTPKSIQ